MISLVFLAGLIFFSWMHYWILLIAWLVVFGVVMYKMGNSDEN